MLLAPTKTYMFVVRIIIGSSKKRSLKKEAVCIDHYLQANAPTQEFLEA